MKRKYTSRRELSPSPTPNLSVLPIPRLLAPTDSRTNQTTFGNIIEHDAQDNDEIGSAEGYSDVTDDYNDDDDDDDDTSENGDGIIDSEDLPPQTPSRDTQRALNATPKSIRSFHPPPHENYFLRCRLAPTKQSSSTQFTRDLLLDPRRINAWKISLFKRLFPTSSSSPSFSPSVLCPPISPHIIQQIPQQQALSELHQSRFSLWITELQNSFNLGLYGYGSKFFLTHQFATYAYDYIHQMKIPSYILVVNPFTPNFTFRDLLLPLAELLLPPDTVLPALATSLLSLIIQYFKCHLTTLHKQTENTSSSSFPRILMIINSFDSPVLQSKACQSAIVALLTTFRSYLAIVCTFDSLNFPLLWDVRLRQDLHFVFHDTTTFTPYLVELDPTQSCTEVLRLPSEISLPPLTDSADPTFTSVDRIMQLLPSLPDKACALFRLILVEFGRLARTESPSKYSNVCTTVGIESRLIYRRALEDMICTTEQQYSDLLAEFIDHNVLLKRYDGHQSSLANERLLLPFSYDDINQMLREIVQLQQYRHV